MNEQELQHLNLPDPVITECVYHMESGNVVDDKGLSDLISVCRINNKKPPAVCAKKIINTDTDIVTYFLLCANSQIFDPREKDSRYRIRNRWKMTRVNRSTYELYIRFLNTNHKTFLHQAERGI